MSRPTEVSTYNPHLLTRDDLVLSFIARRDLLDELVDDLRGGPHQHHLMVGARGSGKTTLLLRLAVAIEDDRKLARTALPLRFPEEQYNIAHPSDFWLNCLDALTDVLEARGDHEGKRKLEAAVASITPLDESERSAQALATLVTWARSARKFLVLLVDNFDLILERLHDAQWALRESLSHDNGLVLVGATSHFIENAISYDSPLYDFFRVHELGPVTEKEARRVVNHLANVSGHSEVATAIAADPGRFRALYLLTGGMPRMLVLLSSVLARNDTTVEVDLERMLDQLTPYYKARFDELPSQSQVVINAVALHWHPITASACAEQTRIDVKVVSAQLHRLVQQGLLTKIALPGSAKLGFLLTERFFNIWYLMRANRRVRQKLAWFVEFLRMWYGEEGLARHAQALLDANQGHDPARMLALATAIPGAAVRRRLESRAVDVLLEGSRLSEIRELLDLEGVDAHLAPVLDRVKALKKLRSRLAARPKLVRAGEAIIGSPRLWLLQKVALIDFLLKKGTNNSLARLLVRRSTEECEIFGPSVMAAISRGELPSLPEIRERADIVALLELAKDPQVAVSRMLITCDSSPWRDEVFGHIVSCGPDYTLPAFASVIDALDRGDWGLAQRWARMVLQLEVPGWGSAAWVVGVAHLFRICVQQGRSLDAAALLTELGLADRLLPLYEALKAVANSNSGLNHLAPEVRVPTAELLALLRLSPNTDAADHSQIVGIASRVTGGRGATRRRTSRRRGRAASGGCRRARARHR